MMSEFFNFDKKLQNQGLFIAFEGKIHNLPELIGIIGTSDNCVEVVLLKLYELFGVDMLSKLDGVFSFAIYDNEAKTVFVARDIFGVKPLYYALAKNEFLCSTEVQSLIAHENIKKEVNLDALSLYLSFQYSVLDESFFKGIFKLPPSHYLLISQASMDDEGKVICSESIPTPICYYDRKFKPENIDLNQAVNEIDNAVQKSISAHVGDDDVGAFLSGGVDSSYIAATFGGKKTFTIGFDYQMYNEIEYAKTLSVSLGIDHVSKIVSTDEYWEHLSKIQYHMGEPLADPAAAAFYFACREASQHVTTALSGEGPDEFFGGYNIYKEPYSLHAYTRLPLWVRKFASFISRILPDGTKGKSFLERGAKTVEERFIGNAHIFTQEECNKILKHKSDISPGDIARPYYNKANEIKQPNSKSSIDDPTKMQYLDIHLWLVGDILLQAEKMSKAHGITVHMPLLSRDIWEIASSLPVEHRVTKSKDKIAFRKAAARHLPHDTAYRKKLGFPVPIRIWLREKKYYDIIKAYFLSKEAELFFKTDELMNLLDNHFSKKHDYSRKIWTIFMFMLWYQGYFKEGI